MNHDDPASETPGSTNQTWPWRPLPEAASVLPSPADHLLVSLALAVASQAREVLRLSTELTLAVAALKESQARANALAGEMALDEARVVIDRARHGVY